MPLAIGLEFFLVLKRGEWEVADWSTDLNLKGCAVIGRGESGQLCYTSPLSIHNMTAAGECIQSEALNVDTLKCSILTCSRAGRTVSGCCGLFKYVVILHREYSLFSTKARGGGVKNIFSPSCEGSEHIERPASLKPFPTLLEYCKQKGETPRVVCVAISYCLMCLLFCAFCPASHSYSCEWISIYTIHQ